GGDGAGVGRDAGRRFPARGLHRLDLIRIRLLEIRRVEQRRQFRRQRRGRGRLRELARQRDGGVAFLRRREIGGALGRGGGAGGRQGGRAEPEAHRDNKQDTRAHGWPR